MSSANSLSSSPSEMCRMLQWFHVLDAKAKLDKLMADYMPNYSHHHIHCMKDAMNLHTQVVMNNLPISLSEEQQQDLYKISRKLINLYNVLN